MLCVCVLRGRGRGRGSTACRPGQVAFYLAVDVTDDIFQVGARNVQEGSWEKTFCWKTGLQLGFEVGGPDALASGKSMAGILHEERSASLKKSMFDLINIGLYPGQTRSVLPPVPTQPSTFSDAATPRRLTPSDPFAAA